MNNEEKLPPQNLEAEQAVLGSLLMDKNAVTKIADKIKPSDFYRDAHHHIFQVVLDLFTKHEPIDIVTVANELIVSGKLECSGGRLYLSDLLNSVVSASNIEYYSKIVKDKSMLRDLLNHSLEITSKVLSNDANLNEILDLAQRSVFNIADKRMHHGYVRIREMLDSYMDNMDKNALKLTGIPTGFTDLDNITGGLQPGELTILAARPSVGKTALALNIAENIALKGNTPLVVFSLEMPKEALLQRIISSQSAINSTKLKSNNLTDNEWHRLSTSISRLAGTPIFIDDTPSINPIELQAKARKLKLDENIGLIIIDFLQLMHGSAGLNRTQEIGEIVRAIKSLARELNIPIIALAQLSRNVEYRDNKRPLLADLRESGEIEQVADVVIFIYREDYYNGNSADTNSTELIIAKHRNGATGKVDLVFKKEFTTFYNTIT